MSNRDKEFKKEAVRLALTSPQPIAKTALDLGIKESTLYSWVSCAKDNAAVVTDDKGVHYYLTRTYRSTNNEAVWERGSCRFV
ncbi:MAG: transposase [Gammaproteobacteria bacterium]